MRNQAADQRDPCGSSRAHGSRYDSAGSAACIGPLGPWLTWGGTGSAVSSGAIVTALGARHCVPSAGHGRVFAVVPREAWFFPPDLTVSGAFRRFTGWDTGWI